MNWSGESPSVPGTSLYCSVSGDYSLAAVAFNFSTTGTCDVDGTTSPVHMDGGGALVPMVPQTPPQGLQVGTQAFLGQLIILFGPSGCSSFTWDMDWSEFGATWAQSSISDGWCWTGTASWASYGATCTTSAVPPYGSDVVSCIPPSATDAAPSTHFQGTYSLSCYCYPALRFFHSLVYQGNADGSTEGPTAT